MMWPIYHKCFLYHKLYKTFLLSKNGIDKLDFVSDILSVSFEIFFPYSSSIQATRMKFNPFDNGCDSDWKYKMHRI